MPRRRQIQSSVFPYHVTSRSNNKERFAPPLPIVWAIFSEQLARVSERYEARVLAFVLMSNHFHLLLQTPLANLGTITNYLLREVSRAMGRRAGRINHMFGGRNKPNLIADATYFAHAYKYVYRNPIEAGLATRVEEYRFSTFHHIANGTKTPFPIHDLAAVDYGNLPRELPDRLQWLNRSYPAGQKELIRAALRRVQFSFTTNRNQRRDVAAMHHAAY